MCFGTQCCNLKVEVPLEIGALSIGGIHVLAGSDNPSIVGVDAPVGSLYLSPLGLFRKTGVLIVDRVLV